MNRDFLSGPEIRGFRSFVRIRSLMLRFPGVLHVHVGGNLAALFMSRQYQSFVKWQRWLA
jgi:hypothetical protein